MSMRRTGMADSHMREELRRNNPLYDRTDSASNAFDAERRPPNDERNRDSFMIKRQQPKPVLRPSPSLAAGVDRGSFERQLELERREALRHAKLVRSELLSASAALAGHEQRRKQANQQARSGDPSGAAKKLFQTKRGVKTVGERMTTHVRAFERAHGDL